MPKKEDRNLSRLKAPKQFPSSKNSAKNTGIFTHFPHSSPPRPLVLSSPHFSNPIHHRRDTTAVDKLRPRPRAASSSTSIAASPSLSSPHAPISPHPPLSRLNLTLTTVGLWVVAALDLLPRRLGSPHQGCFPLTTTDDEHLVYIRNLATTAMVATRGQGRKRPAKQEQEQGKQNSSVLMNSVVQFYCPGI